MIRFVRDDGGRAAAGYRGEAGDCVTRAIAIATETPYQQVYDELHDRMAERAAAARVVAEHRRNRSPRNGVHRKVWQPYLEAMGWVWVPTMEIGSGCRVHLRADELPGGRLIVRVSKHMAAVIDGVLHDTHDCSRDGTRCVYGYWMEPNDR